MTMELFTAQMRLDTRKQSGRQCREWGVLEASQRLQENVRQESETLGFQRSQVENSDWLWTLALDLTPKKEATELCQSGFQVLLTITRRKKNIYHIINQDPYTYMYKTERTFHKTIALHCL